MASELNDKRVRNWRPFAALAAIASRPPTALIILAGFGSLAAPLALAAAIISSQGESTAKSLVTCWNESSITVSGHGAGQARRLNSEFFGINRSAFVTVMTGARADQLQKNIDGAGIAARLPWQPALQFRVIVPSIRIQEHVQFRIGVDYSPAIPRVAPKI